MSDPRDAARATAGGKAYFRSRNLRLSRERAGNAGKAAMADKGLAILPLPLYPSSMRTLFLGRRHLQPWLLTLIIALFVVAHSQQSHAIECSALPNPVYFQVGDTQTNLMKSLGRKLRDNTAQPISLVFATAGSCTNIEAMYTDVKLVTNLQYIPSTVEDPAWTISAPTLSCTLPVGGMLADVANSAVFNSACTTVAPPSNVKLYQGPVQAYVMAVPKASSQTAITAEEAYFVFGFGGAGMIVPWVNEAQMFIRTVTKSTLLSWAANIAVGAEKWKGMRFDKSTEVVTALQNSPQPEQAIGILGVEVYDKLRTSLTALAFRAFKQYAAYLPDSTSTAFDKQNVRDGHYTVWSPTIWMTRVDVAGNAINARAKYVIDLILGLTVTPAANFESVDVVAGVGLVPDCAMKVTRSFEGGNLTLYQAAQACSCRFESTVSTTSCAACTGVGQGTCAAGVCRRGFCEER
jgi:hypothetical protein